MPRWFRMERTARWRWKYSTKPKPFIIPSLLQRSHRCHGVQVSSRYQPTRKVSLIHTTQSVRLSRTGYTINNQYSKWRRHFRCPYQFTTLLIACRTFTPGNLSIPNQNTLNHSKNSDISHNHRKNCAGSCLRPHV